MWRSPNLISCVNYSAVTAATNQPTPTSTLSHIVYNSAGTSGKLFDASNPEFILTSTYWKLNSFQVKGLTGDGTVIAILDTGINIDHHAFGNDQKVLPHPLSKNFIADRREDDITDVDGHGTHCAGIAAGFQYNGAYRADCPTDNGQFTGVAPCSQLIVCRIAKDAKNFSVDTVIEALEHLIRKRNQDHQKIDIVLMSFGFPQLQQEKERQLKELFLELTVSTSNPPAVCIAAASNEGACRDAIWFPAQFEEVISIGAHDYFKHPAKFSPQGQHLDFLAPGVNVYGPAIADNIALTAADGTSSAAPAVAGLVSLLIQCTRKALFPPQPSASSHITKRRVIMKLLKDMSSHAHTAEKGFGVLEPSALLDQLDVPNWASTTNILYQKIKNELQIG